jgi:hypothetical protein
LELGLQITDGALTFAEELEDPDPHRMAQNAKQPGLDDVDRVRPDVHGVGFRGRSGG